jgi:hypothetical protein
VSCVLLSVFSAIQSGICCSRCWSQATCSTRFFHGCRPYLSADFRKLYGQSNILTTAWILHPEYKGIILTISVAFAVDLHHLELTEKPPSINCLRNSFVQSQFLRVNLENHGSVSDPW